MKTLIAAASALALTAAAVPAFAQTADVQLNATVTSACGVGNHKSGAAAAPGWDQTDITVDLTNGGNGQFAGETFNNRSLGNLWCNGASSVTMTVNALKSSTSTSDTGSFTNTFDVRVVTDMGVYIGQGEDFSLRSNNGVAGVQTGANSGAFETGLQRYSGFDSIEVLADPSGRRPVAGSYAGSITVTATAN